MLVAQLAFQSVPKEAEIYLSYCPLIHHISILSHSLAIFEKKEARFWTSSFLINAVSKWIESQGVDPHGPLPYLLYP